MKKLFAIIAVAMASVMVANAQIGIVGGFTNSGTTEINTTDFAKNIENVNTYHVGLAFKLPLPLGFAIQPELLYQVKGADLGEVVEKAGNGEDVSGATQEFKTEDAFAELGIGVQWGIDLVAFRPFVFAKPFVGLGLDSILGADVVKDGTDKTLENAKNDIEYGISIGAGLELLEHFQLSLEFFKNLGNLYNGDEVKVDTEAATAEFTNLESYGGFKVTLGFFF